MTAEQLVGSLLIAIVTAVATAFFNNSWAESRHKNQWEREKEERRAQYKRLRLEEKVRPVEAWVKNVIELAETLRLALGSAVLREIDIEEFHNAYDSASQQLQSLNREFAAIDAMLLAVGDRELTNLLQDFYQLWTELLLATDHLCSLRYPLVPDDRPTYQELARRFSHQRGLLDEKGALLFSKIESILEAVGR